MRSGGFIFKDVHVQINFSIKVLSKTHNKMLQLTTKSVASLAFGVNWA